MVDTTISNNKINCRVIFIYALLLKLKPPTEVVFLYTGFTHNIYENSHTISEVISPTSKVVGVFHYKIKIPHNIYSSS